VLIELRVENLLLIERAELALAPGLNVLTGETGAGKTVLAHALDLLLGGRARAGMVRPGAPEAYVEGVFAMSPAMAEEVGERLPADAEEIVLARRVGADGRTRAYVNGRSAAVSDLRELAGRLLAFYGQHEHRKLTLASAQLEVLDAFCGPEQARARERCAAAFARERELDLLEFELREIEAAAPDEAEHADLLARRQRLRQLDALRSAAATAVAALTAGDGAPAGGAADALAGAAAGLDALSGTDAELDTLAERMRVAAVEAADLASDLRRYEDGLDAEPGALELVEERLAALDRLMRKHGGSIAAVLAHAERCRTRRAELTGVQGALADTELAMTAAGAELDRQVATLREARSTAAPRLADAVRGRLAELAMPDAVFEIELSEREPGPAGGETVEFVIAPNPGVPAAPLREIASGGELSRVMLALTGVAAAGTQATLAFDEIDAGIGGHTARAVGERLRDLARERQVLCITHLPQIASLAARHFAVAKDTSATPTRTTVVSLAEPDVVAELVRMLGAGAQDAAARRHARDLRRAA
jgi:DNA repair protein RecN (Recombination protein N)